MAWNSIFSFQNTPKAVEYRVDELSQMFPDPSICEEPRQFTRLHRIVIGRLRANLEYEIRANHALIDFLDCDGRSPLHWAAARGDAKSVALLLKYGANPSLVDRIKQGPLRSSLKADTPDCMKLLLAANANTEQRDNWGQTSVQAAMYYTDPTPFVRSLLAAGAQVNVSDIIGCSPLSEAMKSNFADAVDLLLRHGADIGVTDDVGATPLQYGVKYNAHEAVANILLRYPSHRSHYYRNYSGQNLLHVAAESAGSRMLGILAGLSWNKSILLDEQDEQLRTPTSLATIRVNTCQRQGSELNSPGGEEVQRHPLDEKKGIDAPDDADELAAWTEAWKSLTRVLKVKTSRDCIIEIRDPFDQGYASSDGTGSNEFWWSARESPTCSSARESTDELLCLGLSTEAA